MVTTKEAVARLAEEGMQFFTVHDLAGLLGINAARAQHLAFRMARTNLARRLRRGTYALVPLDAWRHPEGLPVNWYLAAAALADPAPYYLGYYTAMEIHRMIQHPLRTVFVVSTRGRRAVEAGGVRFRFVTLGDHRFFGFEDVTVEPGRQVNVADLERTFIDCVDRLDLCGGLEEVFRGFGRRHDDLNPDRLIRYLARLKEPTLTKRLGFLLEAAGHGDARLMWELEDIAGRMKRYVPLDKTRSESEGIRNKRWELLLNVDPDDLLAAKET
jgi:predicted transcriptional regulator of viral defense system